MPPLYQEITRELEHQIHSGELVPGARLPTEKELCTRYGVSRATAQRVLNDLTDAGLAIRRRRQGTFVANIAQQVNLISFASPERLEKGVPGRHEVISKRVVRAADALVRLPGAEDDTAVIELVRRKLDLHEQPRTIECHVILFAVAPDLLEQDLAELVSLPYLRSRSVIVDRIRIYLEPVILDDREAELLQSETGSCAMRRRRELRAPDESVLEVVTSIVRPGSAEFYVELPAPPD